jgi:hypothetical protein
VNEAEPPLCNLDDATPDELLQRMRRIVRVHAGRLVQQGEVELAPDHGGGGSELARRACQSVQPALDAGLDAARHANPVGTGHPGIIEPAYQLDDHERIAWDFGVVGKVVIDGPGADFNIYEAGSPELSSIAV